MEKITESIKGIIKKICANCGGKCCRPTHTYPTHHLTLYPGDFTKLFEAGYHSLLSFSEAFGIPQFVIRPHIFGYCPFFDMVSSECRIYDNKPLACKIFPYEPLLTPLKEECNLRQKTKKIRIIELEQKYSSIISSEKYQKKSFEDQSKALFEFKPKWDSLANISTNLLTNEYGTFVLRNISRQKKVKRITLPKLLHLIQKYANFVKNDQIYLSILIIDSEYNPLFFLQGIFGYFMKITQNQLLDKVTEEMNSYYDEILDGSLLDGLISDFELRNDDLYWQNIWNHMKRIFILFDKSKKRQE